MVRNLANLARQTYDVLVIGGGIYGVCIAWDAALRGLSVALVEKGDFGHATSANSLRVIHGGLRYLQHGDILRVRRSICERAAFMRIAPHLVHPLPILIPTYGHSLRGKEIFSIALLLNQIIGFDQNGHLPRNWIISKEECLSLVPGIYKKGLTGAVIVYDCQMSSSERLVLSFARSAHKAGAELANYVEVTQIVTQKGRVSGVKARDTLTGDELAIHATTVVNASGPWMDSVIARLKRHRSSPSHSLSKAFNLLINRQLISDYAVGLYSQASCRDKDAVLDKGSRLFFINPWHNRSLIGTAHLAYCGDPDNFQVTEPEILSFLNEINEAYPRADLDFNDISFVYGGLLPAVGNNDGGVQLARHHQIYDHHEENLAGLISVSGVKFTEARYVAEKAVEAVFRTLGKQPPRCMTAFTPLHDARVEQFDEYLKVDSRRTSCEVSEEYAKLLFSHYGSACSDVLNYLEGTGIDQTTTDNTQLLKAEVLYGIRHEMAQKLSDVIFRRTTLGLPDQPTENHVETCGFVASNELGWNPERLRKEISEVRQTLSQSRIAGMNV